MTPTQGPQPLRKHIIDRPRLTQLLDRSPARVILLTAPAGYGKTVLARQWVERSGRKQAWHECTSASIDVAALTASVGAACADFLPTLSNCVQDRLAMPASAVGLAQALEDDLCSHMQRWPSEAWLVLDDYHVLQGTQADEFVARVLERTPLQLVAAARERPTWATARKILYGEILEVGLDTLAMTIDEAKAVLPDQAVAEVEDLRRLSRGWPAVLGLAAFAPSLNVERELAGALHDYFAEELFKAMPSTLQSELLKLAFLPVLNVDLVRELLGKNTPGVVETTRRLGFSSVAHDRLELHPLLRSFLIKKLVSEQPDDVDSLANATTSLLIRHRHWDDAYDVIIKFRLEELLLSLLDGAFSDLLNKGRIATLIEWSRTLRQWRLESHTARLVEAEISLREGAHEQADTISVQIADAPDAPPEIRARAQIVRGRSAHLDDRFRDASLYYQEAERLSPNVDLAIASLWGRYLATHALGLPESHEIAERFRSFPVQRPEVTLRRAMVSFHDAFLRGTPIFPSLQLFRHAVKVIDEVRDPLVRSGFLQLYGHALMLNGRYNDALRLGQRTLNEAEAYRIQFIRPIAKGLQAFATLGLRRFDETEELVAEVEEEAQSINDQHTFINARIARARLLLTRGEAVSIPLAPRVQVPSPLLRGELLATEALVAAVAGDMRLASAMAQEALQKTSSIEVAILARAIQAVVALSRDSKVATQLCKDALARALHTGNLDSFIIVYRSCPSLLPALWHNEHTDLVRIIRRVSDADYLDSRIQNRLITFLTPREHEVLDLVSKGLSNQEIADHLFISVATVKVHVRHILEKYGVRSRTAAVALCLSQATSAKATVASESAR